MLDVIGAIVLAVLAAAGPAAVVLASPLERRRAIRVLAAAGAWLAAVILAAALGVFSGPGIVTLAAAVVAPVVIVALSAPRVPSLRTLALGTPLAVLVVIHVGRLLGAFFLALHADGRLPAAFALTAGWGDIAVALLAVPVAWMAARRSAGWRAATLVWNAVAFIDLVGAVTLGIGSAPDSPLRFIVEPAAPGTMATLPWALIPAFLVPLYLLAHLAVFARLARERSPASSRLAVGFGRR
jgi:hypothetical protein